jgi:hypothetical protein
MTKRETTSLFIKWVAVYSLISFVSSGLQTLAYASLSWSAEEQMGFQVSITLMMLVYTGLGIAFSFLLICFSDLGAKLLFKTDSAAFQLDRLERGDVQTLGCHFIGLTQVVAALPKLVQILVSIRTRQAYAYAEWSEGRFALETLPQLLAVLAQLGLGLLLLLKPQILANVLRRPQAAPTPPSNTSVV